MSKNSFVFVINSFIELNELHFLIEFLIKKKQKYRINCFKKIRKTARKNKVVKI